MRLSIVAVLTSVASTAVASSYSIDDVELEKRQDNDPAMQCHVSCGSTIRLARSQGYCKDENWLKRFNACLDCALTYDNIWTGYGNKVRAAASACGLDATPKPATDGASSTAASSSAAATPSTTAVEPTSIASQTSSTLGSSNEPSPTITRSETDVSSTAGAVARTSPASSASGTPAATNATGISPITTAGGARDFQAVTFSPLIAILAVMYALVLI